MKYYLETNSLYSIGKILLNSTNEFYTSVFALCELVSGMEKIVYEKRRSILSKVMKSSIRIDWEMPEKIILDSFNISNDYEYVEQRVESLKEIIEKIIQSNTYEELQASYEFANQEYNFEYFRHFDEKWSTSFINSTRLGNQNIKSNQSTLLAP